MCLPRLFLFVLLSHGRQVSAPIGRDPWRLSVRPCIRYVYCYQRLRPSKWDIPGRSSDACDDDKTLGPPAAGEVTADCPRWPEPVSWAQAEPGYPGASWLGMCEMLSLQMRRKPQIPLKSLRPLPLLTSPFKALHLPGMSPIYPVLRGERTPLPIHTSNT